MTTAVATAPLPLTFETAPVEMLRTAPAVRASNRVGDGGPTLDRAISTAWEGLIAGRAVGCLVCGAPMAPRYGASGPAPVGGRCGSCGSTLG